MRANAKMTDAAGSRPGEMRNTMALSVSMLFTKA